MTFRRMAALLTVAALAFAACGGDDDDGVASDVTEPSESADATSPTGEAAAGDEPGAFAAANYTTDLSAVCPNPLTVQKDWLAEAEHAGLYQMIGGGGEMEQGKYSGPLGSTGIDLVILEGGNAAAGDVPTVSTLFAGNPVAGVTPDLAYVSTDDAITFSKQFPVTAVVAPLERNPQILLFDPETYDISTIDDLKAAVDSGAQIYVTGTFFSYVKHLIGQGIPEDAFISGYAGDKERFVTSGGTLINQGYASNEVYAFENETPEWGKPVDYVLIDDLGLRPYPSSISVAQDRLAELAPCLELLVPIMQQAQVDYINDPAEVNALIVEFNDNDYGAPFWKTSAGLNDAAVEVMKEDGLVGNGPNDTLGDFDSERVQSVIDIMVEILSAEGSDTYDPGVTPEAITTNEFIDESIGL